MRTADPTLTAFLASAKKAVVIDLYTFTLLDGTIYRYTTGQMDITYNTHLYGSTGLLIKRNGIKLSRGVQVDALELEIYPTTATIGGIAWLAAVRNGAFDGASLTVTRLFCSDWATPVGSITLFSGQIGEIEIGRSMAKLNVVSLLEKFNIQWPYNVYTPACGWELYGDGCGLSRNSWTFSGKVIAGSTASVINTTNDFVGPDTESETFYPAANADSGCWIPGTAFAFDTIACIIGFYGGAFRKSFMRFPSVLLNKNAVIKSAFLKIYNVGPSPVSASATIQANDVANASAPTSQAEADALSLTSEEINWTIVNGASAVSSDITSLVQTLVNKSAWGSGNAMQFVIDWPSPGGGAAYWSSYEGNPSQPPELTVEWYSVSPALEGFFNQGVIEFKTGLNTGLMRTIKHYDNATGVVTVLPPLEHVPAADDTFDIYPGCNKLMATCSSKFTNSGNYRGMQFIPVPETAT